MDNRRIDNVPENSCDLVYGNRILHTCDELAAAKSTSPHNTS